MAMMKLDATPWHNFLDQKKRNLKVNRTMGVIRLGDVAIKEMQKHLPSGGRLHKSIGDPGADGIYDLKIRGDYTILLVGTKVPYCIFVNQGIARFYPIVAKNKKTLKFFWEKVDKVVYLKAVRHPPVKGKFYLENALMAVIRELNKEATRVF